MHIIICSDSIISVLCTSNYLFLYLYCFSLDLHSFPTRRSSDLSLKTLNRGRSPSGPRPLFRVPTGSHAEAVLGTEGRTRGRARSEEHTSELQSRGHLVCRLLLEKKNDIKKIH